MAGAAGWDGRRTSGDVPLAYDADEQPEGMPLRLAYITVMEGG